MVVVGVVLLVLVAVVFLVLPDMVANKQAVLPLPAEPAEPAVEVSAASQEQLAAARREAQDVLAKLREARQALEEKQVHLWAEEDADAIGELAAKGDVFYGQGAFDQALETYGAALEKAEGLQVRSTILRDEKLAEGNQAIADGDQAGAETVFRLALAIDAANTEASAGLARAQLLPKTLPLLQQARRQILEKNWPQAKDSLEQLLALDKEHGEAQQLLQQASSEIRTAQFNGVMGEGLAALQKGNHADALSRFEQALKINPGSADARASLNQARLAIQARTVARTLAAAVDQESAERWAEAAASYQQVLDKGEGVVDARVGLLRSQARAQLAQGIDVMLADPLRLASDDVFAKASQLLRDAEQISAPGPVLQKQIASLKDALGKARQPVTVQLQSDNKTQVTLLRVGEMGAFASHTLELRPGRYTALGIRPGYRDVRITFEVVAGDSASVEIVCKEPV